ncbi:MAG: TldD/PmbA family protein [Alphaproteobacteria bacterium]|nr:TldD/PmbA family protein [Alphaproteobacteria bacterium]
MKQSAPAPEGLAEPLLAAARRAGADAADVIIAHGISQSVSVRLGATETVERSEGRDLGLRVFVGKRQAIVSSNDFDRATLDKLAERAVAMARAVPEDPYCGLADPARHAKNIPALDLADEGEPSTEWLLDLARETEDAARAVKGITNSEGSDCGFGRSAITLATSDGFFGTYASTRYSLSASVLAGEGLDMQRDYDYAVAIHRTDLKAPGELGRNAGERTVRRLNPRKAESGRVPVVYEQRLAGGLLGHLAGAISGAAIARGTSFLKEKLGQIVFADGLNVIDDPNRKRGLRSRLFDGEGVAPMRRALIENGVLTTWLLDSRAARQLGLATTGHASRGTSSPPSPSASNLYLEPGTLTPEALIKEIGRGLYLTELIGMGVNGVTGDYSRGAAGFWIENGELAFPVNEVTVAGNLKDMFRAIRPANDLVFRAGIDAPTLAIDGMTVAGR